MLSGVAKIPRINPGTLLNNPRLHLLATNQQLQDWGAMASDELWHLEEKFDAVVLKEKKAALEREKKLVELGARDKEGKLTAAASTPGTFLLRVRSIFIAQLAQVIPVTGNSILAVLIPYPVFSIFLIRSSRPSFWGSKATAAFSLAKLTLTAATPSSFLTPRSMFAAQLAQVIPVIGNVSFDSFIVYLKPKGHESQSTYRCRARFIDERQTKD